MKKISITISGHATSFSLESEFYNALKKIAEHRKKSVAALLREIDESRPVGYNLSSAIRVWVLSNLIPLPPGEGVARSAGVGVNQKIRKQ